MKACMQCGKLHKNQKFCSRSCLWKYRETHTKTLVKARANNPKKFSKENQPSPEAKKKGRDLKRQKKMIQDAVMQYQMMPTEELEKIVEDPKSTAFQIMMARYIIRGMSDDKMLIDFVNRVWAYAPQEHKIDKTLSWKLETEHKRDEVDDQRFDDLLSKMWYEKK